MRFHENQRDPAGSNGPLSSIYKNLKNMEERMEDKCYKYVETSHSGFTNEPYVSTQAQLFFTPMFTWFIELRDIPSLKMKINYRNVAQQSVSLLQ